MVAQLKKTIPAPTSIDAPTLTHCKALVKPAKSLHLDAFATVVRSSGDARMHGGAATAASPAASATADATSDSIGGRC
jgi:hypothetical protein